jgi:hypothetical protein
LNKSVFSAEFSDIFGDVLSDVFGDEFPSASGSIPDPTAFLDSLYLPEAAGDGGSMIDFPVNGFDFVLPGQASSAAVAATTDVFDFVLPGQASSAAVAATTDVFDFVLPGRASSAAVAATTDVFDFVLPGQASSAAVAATAGGSPTFSVSDFMSAIAPGIEPMAKKPDGAPGGGPGSGGGGDSNPDPVLAAKYTSGDAEVQDSLEYNIQIEFFGQWSASLMDAFGAAADFLSSIITTDLADDNSAFHTFSSDTFTVDDVLIEAYLPAIDGTGGILGQAGPYSVRNLTTDITTVVGVMEFDIADAQSLETDGNWDAVVLHEMLHVLGVGTLWDNWGVTETEDFGTRRPSDDTLSYIGVEGLAEYQEENGPDSLLFIETDGGSGTAGGHWDDETYTNELMTGYLAGADPYLADWTLASLNDIGYQTVDFAPGVTGENSLSDGINLDDVTFANNLEIVDYALIA